MKHWIYFFFLNMQDFILIRQVLRYSQQDDVILMKGKVFMSFMLTIPCLINR